MRRTFNLNKIERNIMDVLFKLCNIKLVEVVLMNSHTLEPKQTNNSFNDKNNIYSSE